MRFEESERLLYSAPLTMETGVERLEDGGLHIGVLSLLEHCTADMLAHWFGMQPDTDEYRLWHPGAHIYSEWTNIQPDHKEGCVEGTTHKAIEMMAGNKAEALLAYIDPHEIFGEKVEEAKAVVMQM